MSQVLDRIIEEVRHLSPDERQRLRDMLNEEQYESAGTYTTERERRIALSRTIKGKYAYLGATSDDFAARKAEEIALEDRRGLKR